jgi:hypothetical protein
MESKGCNERNGKHVKDNIEVKVLANKKRKKSPSFRSIRI